MKKTLLYIALVVAVIIKQAPAGAQVDHGVFFNYIGGASYNYTPTLQTDLKSPTEVGGSMNLNGIAITNGGGFDYLCHNGMIVGGNGYTYGVSTTGADAKVKNKMGAGLIDVGVTIARKKKYIMYPYIGAGGFGSKFTVTNTTSEKIYIDPIYAIHPAQAAPFTTGGFAFEAGYSFKYFAFKMEGKGKKRYGAVLGLDGGCQYYCAMGRWRNIYTRDLLNEFNRPFILSPYLRLTIGFADFSTKRRDQ